MIKRVLSAALIAGFLTAVLGSTLQFFLTTPLILKAETFEKHASTREVGQPLTIKVHLHLDENTPSETEENWEPSEGLQRVALTALATLVSAVGYALVLAALLLAAGLEPSVPIALRWAIGGFLAISLAPAIGLPPELPGMGNSDLIARQVWWLITVVGSGLGLYLIAVRRSRIAVVLGLMALTAPHIVGAPHGAEITKVPASLAAQFTARSLAVAFVFWAVLGLSLGWAWGRLENGREDAEARG